MAETKWMSWLRRTFSDGKKPSLARQLLALLTLTACVAVLLGKDIPDPVGEMFIGLCGWASFSRFTARKEPGDSEHAYD